MKKLLIIGGCLLLSLLLLPKWHGKSKAPFRLYRVAIDRAGGGDGTVIAGRPTIRPPAPDAPLIGTAGSTTLRTTLWTQVTRDPADDFEAK